MDNTAKKEHRKRERIPYSEELLISYMMTVKVKAIDISKGGLYVHTGQTLEAGTTVEVLLPFKKGKLKVKAKIRHTQEGVGMGLSFIELDDTQSAQIMELIEATRKKPPKFRAEKPTVLFVDDNETSRKMIKHKLISEGFWVVEAKDGIEAINILHEEPVDIMLLDLYMEKMDGFKVLSIVKGSLKWKTLPVIVYTANSTEGIVDKAINAGADDFLLKSITSPHKLADVMRKIIKRQENQTNSIEYEEK
jgi:CheY-like chemotaxis protein